MNIHAMSVEFGSTINQVLFVSLCFPCSNR